jgi:hypothetical protein
VAALLAVRLEQTAAAVVAQVQQTVKAETEVKAVLAVLQTVAVAVLVKAEIPQPLTLAATAGLDYTVLAAAVAQVL